MKTVLVVEGKGPDQEALQKLLQDHGYKIKKSPEKPLQVCEVAKEVRLRNGKPGEQEVGVKYRSCIDGKLYEVKQVKDALYEVSPPPYGSERHYRDVYQSAPVGIFRSSIPGKLLSVNPVCSRMLKYDSPRDMIETVNRTGIAETIYLDASHREEILSEVLSSNDWHVFEEKFRCKDGSLLDCFFQLRAVRDDQGRPLEFEGFVQDDSIRKRAERKLLFTQFAIDNSVDQAFIVNEQGRFVYVNDAATYASGYSRPELLELSIFDIDPDCSPELFTQRWQELKRHNSTTFERRHQNRDGYVYPVEIRANYLTYEGQEYICLFATDITERKRAEQALKFTQFAIDNSIDQAFWSDKDGRFIYVNDAACRVLGYSREELLQMSVPEIAVGFSTETFNEHQRELKEKGFLTFETLHRAKDGRVYQVEIRANHVVFDGKEYICAFATDISERKRTEEALMLSQEMIDKASMGIFRGSDDARILFVNDYWARKLGYTPAELRSVTFFDIDPTLTQDFWREHRKELAASGSNTFESVHRCKDGTDIPVEVTVNLFKYRDQVYSCSFAKDISERKMAEKFLRQANLVLENSPVVLFRWQNAEGWPVEMVSGNVSQFGYSQEELLSGYVPFAELVHPQDLDRVAAEVQEHIRRGEDRFTQEYRIVTKQGEARWVDDRTVIERDAEGRAIHFQGIVLDITERKRTEKALRESERKYRSIVEHAPFGITHSTKEGKLLSANPALASILKYDSAEELMEIINRSSIQDVLFPKPSQREPLVENILAGDSWTVFNNRLRCKDGSIVTCRVHSRRIVDADGQARGFESYQENITEQVAAEQALRESEERFRVLAETSPVAICIYRGERVTYANPAMERLFGYSAEELCRMKFWEWVHEDDQQLVRNCGISRLAGEAVPCQYEVKYVTKAGEELCVLVSAGVMKHQTGNVGVASFLNITERKRTEELIRKSLEEKEVLLREVHHRVKNNLQVVSSLLYLQAQKLADPELQRHFLESQNRICSMALAHEQLYQSKSLAEVRVNSYVESLVGQLHNVFRAEQQEIKCQLDIEEVVLDIEKVVPCGLLITELLSNAYKHAFPDGREGSVSISMHRREDHLVLSVADDGVGLPADLDYRQTATLGLQLVMALVNQLNGTLEVEREGGTLFRVDFAV